jgi:trans-aconitate methyltransferase
MTMNAGKLYDLFSTFYDQLFLRFLGYQKAAKFNLEHLPIKSNEGIRIMDAGCGTGLYTLLLLEKYPNSEITSIVYMHALRIILLVK